MRILILASAIDDLESGKAFYDLQELGVGDYFQECLISEIESLVLYAGIHRSVFGYHRLLSKRFPYAVYYRIDSSSTVVIHRVLDCRQNPKRTRKSLQP